MKKLLCLLLGLIVLPYIAYAGMTGDPTTIDEINPPTGTLTVGGKLVVGGGPNEEIEFDTFGEKILQDTDDVITLQGNSGSSDSDINIHLDGDPQILSSTGTLVLGGFGNTNNEKLALDFEQSTNAVRFETSTSINSISLINMDLSFADVWGLIFGGGIDARMRWETTNNDSLQIGTGVGETTATGYISIMERADMSNANRSPLAASVDPVLRVYSSDATEALDYIEMFHDRVLGVIKNGGGDLYLDASEDIRLDAGGAGDTSRGIELNLSTTNMASIMMNLNTDQVTFGLDDDGGNQLVITNFDNDGKDHDHGLTTNPTLFIHSDTDPDDQNTQYLSITHDQDDAIYSTGRGGHVFEIDAQAARGTITVTGIATADQTFVVNSTTITAKADGSGNVDWFTIGGSASAAVTNMVATINEGSETANVFALDGAGDTVVVEWRTAGTAGNSITFTEGLANATIDGGGTLGATTLGKAADILGEINQGDSDVDITYWLMYNADGEVCYVYPNATQDGILVSASKP